MGLKQWNQVTSVLPWGVQHLVHDTLNLVKDEKIHVVYGQDYADKSGCLINTIAHMLKATNGEGGKGIPSHHFGPLVAQFDNVNRMLYNKGVNQDHYVSPLAAEVLLRNFGELREKPEIVNDEVLLKQMQEFANEYTDSADNAVESPVTTES